MTDLPPAFLLATRNPGKAAEAKRIFAAADGPPLIALADSGVAESAEEDELERFDAFEANASAKARYFARQSGLPTIADDSGLEVDALGGRPGVRSKRFASRADYPGLSRDQANNRHLLRLLEGVPDPERRARYVCVAALVLPADPAAPGGGTPVLFRGEAPGLVLLASKGTGGFGYDPLILHEPSGRSYAEMAPDEKDRCSHRGAAFRALARFLATASSKTGCAQVSRTGSAAP